MNRRTFLQRLTGALALCAVPAVAKELVPPASLTRFDLIEWHKDPHPLRFIFKDGAFEPVSEFIIHGWRENGEWKKVSVPNPDYYRARHEGKMILEEWNPPEQPKFRYEVYPLPLYSTK